MPLFLSISARPFFWAALISALSFSALRGQAPASDAPKPQAEELGKTSIRRHAWSDSGSLVLAVNIQGGKSGTNLGGVKGKGSSESLALFSMASSSLLDLHSNKTLQPLGELPKKPFYGPMTGIIRLEPGDAIIFGVAFPRPPEPPKDKDGKIMDYRLRLTVPNLAPLDFSIPFQPPAPR